MSENLELLKNIRHPIPEPIDQVLQVIDQVEQVINQGLPLDQPALFPDRPEVAVHQNPPVQELEEVLLQERKRNSSAVITVRAL